MRTVLTKPDVHDRPLFFRESAPNNPSGRYGNRRPCSKASPTFCYFSEKKSVDGESADESYAPPATNDYVLLYIDHVPLTFVQRIAILQHWRCSECRHNPQHARCSTAPAAGTYEFGAVLRGGVRACLHSASLGGPWCTHPFNIGYLHK